MILVSHPTGNANVRNAARALDEAGALGEFWTSVAWSPDSALARLLPRPIAAELARRSFEGLPAERIRTTPLRELARLANSRLGHPWLTRHEHGLFSVDAVYRSLDRAVARRIEKGAPMEAVYAVEDGALHTFTAAARAGWGRIYELPIGYWRAAQQLYREEAEREPAWAPTLTGMNDSAAKLERKDRELAAAETVLVPSEFTRRTLELAPARPAHVHVIPFGGPAVLSAPTSPPPSKGKLRVLFVGALGQRKGLSYLLEAVRPLGQAVELTLIGRKTNDDCAPLNDAVKTHRWLPSLPHHELLAEMARHDVLAFPTLFEGFALVILEALSRGLAVITTENSGSGDTIRSGENGFLIPIRSAQAIEEKLELLARDRALLEAMKAAALRTAESSTWAAYRRRLAETLLPSAALRS